MAFDVSIITCCATYYRLSRIFEGLLPLLNTGLVRDVRVILEHDISYMDFSVFHQESWVEHIDAIRDILALNIRDCGSFDSLALTDLIDCVTDRFFPERGLRPSEMSLLWKHYHALKKVNDLPLLILEDDAELLPESLGTLDHAARYSSEMNCFIDLGTMPGMESRGKYIEEFGFSLYLQAVGCTRTTVAAIWPPEVAKKVTDSYWPASLPADLHHQYLLTRLGINGAWPRQQVFNHLSGTVSNTYASSI